MISEFEQLVQSGEIAKLRETRDDEQIKWLVAYVKLAQHDDIRQAFQFGEVTVFEGYEWAKAREANERKYENEAIRESKGTKVQWASVGRPARYKKYTTCSTKERLAKKTKREKERIKEIEEREERLGGIVIRESCED